MAFVKWAADMLLVGTGIENTAIVQAESDTATSQCVSRETVKPT